MYEDRTEAQKRAASMLLVVELALNDLYPGRVSGTGYLWDRKIRVWMNDLVEIIIDFAAEEGIRVRILRAEKQAGETDGEGNATGGGWMKVPTGDFILALDANLDAVHEFLRDIIVDSADAISLDPKKFVYKIIEVAHNTTRLRQAMSAMEGLQPPAPVTPQR